ncbi:helix-turn-helix domain-containing protein [Actinomadura fibrosa]|uniref:Scr1 family TA system antitoxin-like transcriptional regulator n=1 Tax=Actinomadura fibrosa TaxID=111802 RepID=A0ABW2XGQ8_9ACTN|nr:DUF5753 domain-containing protein [Actinomadura fibrosa]
MSKIEPTPGTLRFGAIMADALEVTRLTNAQLAAKIPISATYIGQILRGTTRCTRDRAERIDVILGADGGIVEAWERYVKDSDRPRPFVDYADREAEAVLIQSFENTYVTGLVQTKEYAARLSTEEELRDRLARQEIFDRENVPDLRIVLDESVLHRMVGDPGIMRQQLEHLLMVSEGTVVTVQVATYRAETRAESSFVMATLPDMTMIAFLDTLLGGETVHAPKLLARLHRTFTRLQAQALNAEESRAFLRKVIKERWS